MIWKLLRRREGDTTFELGFLPGSATETVTFVSERQLLTPVLGTAFVKEWFYPSADPPPFTPASISQRSSSDACS